MSDEHQPDQPVDTEALAKLGITVRAAPKITTGTRGAGNRLRLPVTDGFVTAFRNRLLPVYDREKVEGDPEFRDRCDGVVIPWWEVRGYASEADARKQGFKAELVPKHRETFKSRLRSRMPTKDDARCLGIYAADDDGTPCVFVIVKTPPESPAAVESPAET